MTADGVEARVLWLSNETADIHGQGGQRRQYFQIRELTRAGVAVDVWTLAGPHSDAALRTIAAVTRIHRSRRAPLRTALDRSRLRRALRSGAYDAVVVAHLESWPLVRAAVRGRRIAAPVLVDLHNVWSAWALAQGDDDAARQWREREAEVLTLADAVSVCSAVEAERLGGSGRAVRIVAPHGIDPDEWPDVPRDPAGPPAIGAFGNWSWRPNRAGIVWFAEQVWPQVRSRVPAAQLIVAGAGLPEAVAAREGVRYLGRVPDFDGLRRDVDVVVTPVREGVGAPVKFAEAIATGRAVVSTTDAAGAERPPGATVSDSPADWAAVLTGLLRHPDSAAREGEDARAYARSRLTWRQTTAPIVDWITAPRRGA